MWQPLLYWVDYMTQELLVPKMTTRGISHGKQRSFPGNLYLHFPLFTSLNRLAGGFSLKIFQSKVLSEKFQDNV